MHLSSHGYLSTHPAGNKFATINIQLLAGLAQTGSPLPVQIVLPTHAVVPPSQFDASNTRFQMAMAALSLGLLLLQAVACWTAICGLLNKVTKVLWKLWRSGGEAAEGKQQRQTTACKQMRGL